MWRQNRETGKRHRCAALILAIPHQSSFIAMNKIDYFCGAMSIYYTHRSFKSLRFTSRLCLSVHFPTLTYSAFISPPSSLYSVSVNLTRLAQSFQGCLAFRRVQTHTHTSSSLAQYPSASQSHAPALPITTAPPPVLLNTIRGTKRACLHTAVPHSSATRSISFPLLPSIILLHRRVEWQLVTEEPRRCAQPIS